MDQGCDTKGQRERNENVEVDQGCDKRERGMRMLRWIKGVTLRNERNENVEVDQGCDTKEQRERNENVEVDQGCDTKRERGMRMLRSRVIKRER